MECVKYRTVYTILTKVMTAQKVSTIEQMLSFHMFKVIYLYKYIFIRFMKSIFIP